MKRAELLESLPRHGVFDLAVVGGGATGLGVALDAALRGFSVVLLESHDFAGGTSSRSTKLLHGGVRYLAQGNLALVREALAERATVLRIAPHLAQPLPFVMPSYRWWQTPFYGLGLKLYDLLAGGAGLGRTEFLDREQALREVEAQLLARFAEIKHLAVRGNFMFSPAHTGLDHCVKGALEGISFLDHVNSPIIRRAPCPPQFDDQ